MVVFSLAFGPGTGPLPEDQRVHTPSEGPDSIVGIYCEYCYVTWPCLAARMTEGRRAVAEAVEAEVHRQVDAGDLVDWLEVARVAVKANDAIDRTFDSSSSAPALYKSRWTHDGDPEL